MLRICILHLCSSQSPSLESSGPSLLQKTVYSPFKASWKSTSYMIKPVRRYTVKNGPILICFCEVYFFERHNYRKRGRQKQIFHLLALSSVATIHRAGQAEAGSSTGVSHLSSETQALGPTSATSPDWQSREPEHKRSRWDMPQWSYGMSSFAARRSNHWAKVLAS